MQKKKTIAETKYTAKYTKHKTSIFTEETISTAHTNGLCKEMRKWANEA